MVHYIEQNNPGGGDCGFYAFANGLIPYLQKELSQENGETPLWNKLQELLDAEHRDPIKQQIKDYDFRPPNNRDPLSALNIALRKCVTELQKKSLEEVDAKIARLDKYHGYSLYFTPVKDPAPLEIFFELSTDKTVINLTAINSDKTQTKTVITRADIEAYWQNKIEWLANTKEKAAATKTEESDLTTFNTEIDKEKEATTAAKGNDLESFHATIIADSLTPINMEPLLPTIFQILKSRQHISNRKIKEQTETDIISSKVETIGASNLLLTDALAIFWHYFDNSTNRNELNSDAYRNPAFRHNMQSLATELKKNTTIKKKLSQMPADSPETRKFHSKLNTIVIDRLLRGKMLAPLIEEKLRQGTWATASDLQDLAEHFGVEFQCHDTNHRNVTYGTVEEDKPVIRLRNNASIHWTTLLDPFPLTQGQPPEAEGKIVLALARKYMKQPHDVTIDEIQQMFQSYIPTRFGFFNNRHHVPAVRSILSKCNEKEGTTPESVLQYIAESIDTTRANATGDFQARLDYLALRVTGKSYREYKENLETNNTAVITAVPGQ